MTPVHSSIRRSCAIRSVYSVVRPVEIVSILAFSVVFSSSLNAQSPATTAEETVELSVFEVDASQDTGYQAQNTLAGTRLNTRVQDIGGTMTVVTPQLWEDFALTSTNDLLRFTPGGEKEDVQQQDGNGQMTFFGDNTRVRGIRFENIVRNSFRTNIPSDTYNASRFEFQRGPNAILFGTTGAQGGASGLVNRTTQDASFQDKGTYQLTVDEFGSIRNVLSYNKELIDNKLAVFVALLDDRTNFWVEPAFQDQKRIYAALQYRPVEKLSIKVRYEWMDWLRTAYAAGMDYDGVTWVTNAAKALGKTPAELAIVSSSSLQQTYPSLPEYYQNNGYRTQNTTSLVYGGSNSSPTLENWRYKVIGRNNEVIGTNTVSLPPGFAPLDFSILGHGNTQDFEGYNIQGNIQYSVSKKLNLEYAYNYEFMNYDFISVAGTPRLQIDGSSTLQDGVTPNPRAGAFWVDFYPGFTLFQDRINTNHRFTASFEHDFTEGERMGWMGKHTFVAMAESYNQTHYWDQKRLLNTTPLPGYPSDLWPAGQQNAIRFVNYVDLQNKTFSGVHNSQDFEAEANKIPGIKAEWLPVVGAGQAFDETTDSLLFVWQGRFWDDRLVTTAGLRKDYFTRFGGQEHQDPDAPVGVAIPAREIVMTKDEAQSALAPSTKNYAIVFHAVRNVGFIDYLSPYYNFSDAFASGVFTSIPDGSKTPNATGDTTDYGIKFGLFNGKVSGVFSLFEATNFNIDQVRSINFGELSDLFEYLDPVKYAQYINVSNVRETEDIRSEGWEFQVTANITSNWRATFMADHFTTELTNIAPTTGAIIEDFRDDWLRNPTDIVPNTNRTVEDVFTTMNFSYLAAKAQEGSVTSNERPYRVTFLTNYSFNSGVLKGFEIGTNIAWQDKPATGFALQNIGGTWVPDPNHPFFGSDLLRVGANMSYNRKLFGDKVHWRVQLNVRDIGGTDPYVVRQGAVSSAPTTPVTTYWHRGFPQTFILTNTFRF